jgi:hypothetical protein
MRFVLECDAQIPLPGVALFLFGPDRQRVNSRVACGAALRRGRHEHVQWRHHRLALFPAVADAVLRGELPLWLVLQPLADGARLLVLPALPNVPLPLFDVVVLRREPARMCSCPLASCQTRLLVATQRPSHVRRRLPTSEELAQTLL